MDTIEPGNPPGIEELWETYDAAAWESPLASPDDSMPAVTDTEERLENPGIEIPDDLKTLVDIGLDPHWIDLETIRQWLYTCDFDPAHGEKCILRTPEYAGMPLWLIDVVNEGIVPSRTRQYVALSYVWGQVTSSAATTDNIASLQKPGALREDNTAIVVPRTARHTMKLVNLLGQRYLWVDRLCICQDDAQTKHSQLHLMGDIYSNVYLTIIAANGWDADHGLRGIRGVTDARQLSAHTDIKAYIDHIELNNSVWDSRGLTFQELMLSRRKLIFINQMVIWECGHGIWHKSSGTSGDYPGIPSENAHAFQDTHNGLKGVTPKLRLLMFDQPNRRGGADRMIDYSDVIAYYNTRNLTFPEDGLEAFLGVTTRIMDAFSLGFHWGLPISSFDLALTWQPTEDMIRRRPRTSIGVKELPSWSWVGWQGAIDGYSWNMTYPPQQRLRDGDMSAREMRALCTWSKEENGARIPVVPSQEIKPKPGDKVASRLKNLFSSSGRPSHSLPSQPRLLYTRASVAVCKFGESIGGTRNLNYNTILRQIKHPWNPKKGCGSILMTASLSSGTSDSNHWELMAISRSGTRGYSDTALKAQSPAFAQMLASYPSNAACRSRNAEGNVIWYDYYNVLWISTSSKDGISRRRALGIMSIEAWAAINPRERDIVLG